MPQPAVEALTYLLDEAFDGRGIEESNESQALLTNLANADYAFGTGTKEWGTHEVEGPWEPGTAPMAEAIDWLREAHRSFREHVAGLTDDDLGQPRKTNWGEMRPTSWIIAAIIGHDFYHAGEINHLRG